MPEMGDDDLEVYAPKDSLMFRRIRDVLAAHNLLAVFGIYLVHKHFPIADDEEMVEQVDFDSGTVRVTPLKRTVLHMDVMVPTNWFFSPNDTDKGHVFIAQWGYAKDLTNAERKPFSHRYALAFEEIRNILVETNSISRFGMFLRRHQFTFEMDENLLECTDQETRTLIITAESKQEAPGGTVPTNWIFTPDEAVANSCCNCAKNNSGYHTGQHASR
jgi:hypothetical protein